MKKLLVVLSMIIFCVASADAATHVRGHVRKSTGKYVSGHYRSSSDKSKSNNYSTRGNINPYTGKKGTKKAY
ncbi:MAG: hypothetical protein FWC61_03250 [Proteobacteria bacterium]|nr:hypothetical protein [Pseudomonadota bacterium]